MKKADIQKVLATAGITFPANAKVDELEKLAADNGIDLSTASNEPEMVSVVATAHLSEGGVYYKPGDSFEVTEERREALGELVK
ncbi:hypothetical protein JIN85_16915 [Luteolibacter pohnpeiensis]|uniref:Uncharacterized protein n=1 Tax=Luteolibacter pohnpeiensis TaxID=454153 RepID=A0A934VY25_9BACT|nr:hypothetical protein [Luteolibacter pohnpeiensis]MBK1884104.1 hypothetical protein [Luteolibacter pohnpeiensis]